MDVRYLLLYNDMLACIERCFDIDLPELEQAESCFWITSNYWNRLKELKSPLIFENEEDEIDFFKNVKPGFTGMIEYYTILYEGLLCEPEDPVNAIFYWTQELKRFSRFYIKK